MVFKEGLVCGSSTFERLFCWPCLLLSPGISSTWTKTGYTDMRSLIADGKKHEKGKSHLSVFKTCKTYGASAQVDSLLSQARRDEILRYNEELRQNHEILSTVTEAVLSKQELAFTGHDESEDSLSKGNYRELLYRVFCKVGFCI